MQADRDIEKLGEPFKSRVKSFLAECPDIFVTEAYRSKERQEWLYASGRTREGAVITWTLDSNHCKGMAIDIAFHGAELYPTDFTKWRRVADVAKKYQINWGYDMWGVDKAHFEWSGTTVPDKDTDEFLNYEKMTESQKQLVQSMIYSFKNSHNFGTLEMKALVEEQVTKWKALLNEGEQ